jgi:hypothetical protein
MVLQQLLFLLLDNRVINLVYATLRCECYHTGKFDKLLRWSSNAARGDCLQGARDCPPDFAVGCPPDSPESRPVHFEAGLYGKKYDFGF